MRSHRIGGYLHPFFNNYLVGARGLSHNTVLAYRDCLKLFICFAADSLGKPPDALVLEELTETVVLDFLDDLERTRGNCVKTRNNRLAGIRSFYGFVSREEPCLIDLCGRVRAIPIKRAENKQIEPLDDKEVGAILNAVDINATMGMRDKALLQLLYNTGARVQEIVDLHLGDLRLDKSGQVKLIGKGRRQRACPLWPETVQALKNYLNVRRAPNDNALFLNSRNKPITRFGIGYIVKKYVALAAEHQPTLHAKNVTPHTIRHSTAMMLLHAKQGITVIRDWLGHADIRATHCYACLDLEMKREILERIDSPSSTNKPQVWHHPRVLAFLENLTGGGAEARRAQLS